MSAQKNWDTIGRWVSDRARMAPDHVAIHDRGVRITYRALEERVADAAARLAAAGYGRGDRIATLTGNSSEHIVLLLACARLGAAMVPVSWRLTAYEIAQQLITSQPALVMLEHEYAELGHHALEKIPDAPPSAEFGELHRELPAAQRTSGPPLEDPPTADDPLLLLFTSGSSGLPKAALLTQGNCFWNNLSFSRTVPMDDTDVVLTVLPQFHAGGWNVQTLLALWVGATLILERVFNAERILHLVEEHGVTTMMGVPTTYQMLADHPRFAETDMSSMRTLVVGGAPMPVQLLRTYHARDVKLTQGYGLTETSPNTLGLPAELALEKIGSAGIPYPHVDCAIADPETGEILTGEATGELLVAGPGVFAGYFNNPEATDKVLKDGWFHTGDLVRRDADGCHFIVDRIKEMYISGGENVSPTEVESVLTQHPGIQEAAVVGIPHERWGEVGRAVVVRTPGETVEENDLRDFCRERLARFKVPAEILFVDALPRNALNKVRKYTLRDDQPAPEAGEAPLEGDTESNEPN